jgi:hypothetical protein
MSKSNLQLIITEIHEKLNTPKATTPIEIEEKKPILENVEVFIKSIKRQQEIKTRRTHRRNSSLNFQLNNDKVWLNNAYRKFKQFIGEILVKCDNTQRNNLSNWLLKIEGMTLPLFFLSIQATKEFKPILSSINREGKTFKLNKMMCNAINELTENNDIDLYVLTEQEKDKLIRFFLCFVIASVEN